MKPSLLSFESLRYLFGPAAPTSATQAGTRGLWDTLEGTAATIKALGDNCACHGASLLLAPPGFRAEAIYQRLVDQLQNDPEILCIAIPAYLQEGSRPPWGDGRGGGSDPAEGAESTLLRALSQAIQAEGIALAAAPLDWQGWRQLLESGALPWKRVVFAVEDAHLQLSSLWLQPGSRSAGGLRRLLSHFRASAGRLGLIGFLDTCRVHGSSVEGGRLESIIHASGDELACLTEAFPGVVPFLFHLDMDGLSILLRGPLLEVRRPALVAEIEAHPALRRCLATCLRLLPQWRASGAWYPLHPLTWAFLPRLCALFPHPERNFWGYFSQDIPGALPYFLSNCKILNPQGDPNLYPLDGLFQYFEPVWHTREWEPALSVLQQACHRARNYPLSRRLLRALWLLQIVHHSAFPCTQALLMEALQLGEVEAARVSLKGMVAEGILEQDGFGEELQYSLPGLTARQGGPPAILQTYLRRFADSTDLQIELRARLPLRRLKLYSFNRTHCSDRWVRVQLTTYQGLEEAGPILPSAPEGEARSNQGGQRQVAEAPQSWWETQLSPLGAGPTNHYEGDMLLLYVALLDQEERSLFQSQLMQGRWRHPRLIIAYPKSESAPLRSARQELRQLSAYRWGTRLIIPYCDFLSAEAQEIAAKLELLQSSITRKFRQFFAPENLDFYCAEGGVESNLDFAGLHRLLHERFLRVVGEPPVVPDVVFACVGDRPGHRKIRRAALSMLLQGHHQLAVWEHSGRASQALVNGLVKTGLAQIVDQGPGPDGQQGWYVLAPPSAQVWSMEAPGLPDVYSLLEEQLLRPSQHHESFVRALTLLTQPPHSLTQGTCELLLAVFFWCHYSSCMVFLQDGPEGPGGRQVPILDVDLVFSIVAEPHRYAFRYASQSNDAQSFLLGIILDLDRDFQRVEGVDLWKAAGRRLRDWYAQLEEKTVRIGRERTPFNRPLLELLGRLPERGLDERRLFEKQLPAALGFSVEGRRNWPMETQGLLDRFRMIRASIERAVSSTRELLHLGLTEIFFEPTLTLMGRQLDWPLLVQRWHESLAESTRDVALESPIHRLIADLAVCAGGEQDGLLDYSLAQLGYPPIEHWLQDYVPEILERFRLAKEEIENADLLGLFPCSPQIRWQRVEELIRRVLLRVDLTREELHAVVAAELESFWDR